MRGSLVGLKSFVLPTGATSGTRFVFNGVDGIISLYDENDDLVGQWTPDGFILGKLDGSRVSIDPFGGIRITNEDGTLIAILDPTQGLQIRDPDTGVVQVVIQHDGIFYTDDTATDTIVMGTTPGLPIPRYGATPTETGAAGIATTPAVEQFGVDDLEIRHSALFHGSADLTGESFNALAGYTRILNETNYLSIGGSSLAACVATRQPAVSNFVRLWQYSDNTINRTLGTTVVVEATPGVAPSVRSINGDFFTYSSPIVDFTMTGGATAVNDLQLAFVAFANDNGAISLPASWSTPRGWVFLGATFASATSPLAVGVWAKLSTSAVAPVETVRLTKLGGTSPTQIHWSVLSIQNAKLLPRYTDLRVNGRSVPRGRIIPLTLSTGASPALAVINTPQQLPGTTVTVTNDTGGVRRYEATARVRFNMSGGANGLYRPAITDGAGTSLSTSPVQVTTNVVGGPGQVGGIVSYEFTLAPGASQQLAAGGTRLAGGAVGDTITLGDIKVDDIGE